jgi:flagellar basal-body rod modification protein FlgD
MIGSVTSTTDTSTTSAASSLGQLDSDAFLKLLVAQMKYQNPLSPTDASGMLQQTAQFTMVETLKAIAQTNQSLLGSEQTNLALGTVGKQVNAYTTDGDAVTGVVNTVRFTADGPMLELESGLEIPLANVIEVAAPPETAAS